MRLLQISPCDFPVADPLDFADSARPELGYASIERVLAELVKGQSARHEVTLLAAGDSREWVQLLQDRGLNVTLIEIASLSARGSGHLKDPAARAELDDQLRQVVLKVAPQYDVIHAHAGHVFWPCHQYLSTPLVTTIHVPPLARERELRQNPGVRLVALSQAQMDSAANLDLNWMGVVPNGMTLEGRYEFNPNSSKRVAWIGRIVPFKGAHKAIEIAEAAGLDIVLGGWAPPPFQDYFTEVFMPAVRKRRRIQVDFLGELDDVGKNRLLGEAGLLLHPHHVQESCPLVPLEAMACGTPVVTTALGGVVESVRHGKYGYLLPVDATVGEWVEACHNALTNIDRESCRRHVLRDYSVERMVRGYDRIYRSISEQEILERHEDVPMSPPLMQGLSTRG